MEWISVKDKLPQQDVGVIVVDDEGGVCDVCLYREDANGGVWCDWNENIVEVSYWMPTPKLPKDYVDPIYRGNK